MLVARRLLVVLAAALASGAAGAAPAAHAASVQGCYLKPLPAGGAALLQGAVTAPGTALVRLTCRVTTSAGVGFACNGIGVNSARCAALAVMTPGRYTLCTTVFVIELSGGAYQANYCTLSEW